jgi:glycosyltransferase involved in cell wall biosynthesis
MKKLRNFLKTDVGWIILVGLILVVVQIGATLITAFEVEQTSGRIANDLAKLQATTLIDEKTRQETLNLRIQNEIRGYLWNSLLTGTGPIVTAFVALVGVLLGLRNFLEAREKDRRDRLVAQGKDRADREKARLDRASSELKDTMDRLVKEETWQRAAGILGLQHFLGPDLRDYHLRAISALAMAARIEKDPLVIDTIRIAIEQAVTTVSEDVLQQAVWQWAKLSRAKFSGRSLRALDFRNASLEDSDFSQCDLSNALFGNAQLNGANLDRCQLVGADLTYADLAGATLIGANLTDASLYNAKVAQMDIAAADLRGAKLDVDAMPWELIANWRKAILDDDVRKRLVDQFGDELSGPKVLMLMWEVPPFVAGGTWTACYHLVRNLRRRGADVTVVVPWAESLVVSHPFGSEVRVVALGITPPEVAAAAERSEFSVYSMYAPRASWSPYGSSPSWSPYGSSRPWSPYGSSASWSPYGSSPSWSPYGSSASWSPYGSSPSWSPYGWLSPAGGPSPYASTTPRGFGVYGGSLSGYAASSGTLEPSMLLRLIDECRRRFVRFARSETFDVIHAHDWVTFDAAAAASTTTGRPWIAHFHSIERDRRPDAPDRVIESIERDAIANASALAAPSKMSAQRIADHYNVAAARITVAPNTLSRETIPPSDLGLYDTRRTLFLGRLTSQKGPDLFARVASEVRKIVSGASFEVRGGGEYIPELSNAGIVPGGAVEWNDRGQVFRDASAVLVPSRAEPFGMVILEAMQHRVPVLYPQLAGAAEVLNSGVKIDPNDIKATAVALAGILNDRNQWEEVAMQQAQEIKDYWERGYEEIVQSLYKQLTPAPAASAAVAKGRS